MEQLIAKLRKDLESELEGLYLPKISDSHLSHLILYHLLNAASEFDIAIKTLTIRETSKRVYFINVNQQTESPIILNLNQVVPCTTSLSY